MWENPYDFTYGVYVGLLSGGLITAPFDWRTATAFDAIAIVFLFVAPLLIRAIARRGGPRGACE